MKVIVGLGNPGGQYNKTPHNAGFMAMDIIHSYLMNSGYICSEWNNKKKEKSEISEILTPSRKRFALLVKPMTFMNLSGSAMYQLIKSYGIKDLNELLVIYDELDIMLGKFKYSPVRNSHTHKGIASIINTIGKNFHSLRIGVDNRGDRRISGSSLVLKRYSEDDLVTLNRAISDAIELHVKPFLGLV